MCEIVVKADRVVDGRDTRTNSLRHEGNEGVMLAKSIQARDSDKGHCDTTGGLTHFQLAVSNIHHDHCACSE